MERMQLMPRLAKRDMMSSDEEQDAVVSVPMPDVALLVLARILQGDSHVLKALGLAEADLYHLRLLPSDVLPRLIGCAARGHDIVEIRFHRRVLRRFLQHLKTDSQSEREMRIMIEAEASYPFMRHFYSLSYAVYHQYRQRASLLRSAGRPPAPGKTTQREISALLQKLDLLSRLSEIGPFDLLAIHQLTGYPLRDVWSVYIRLLRLQQVA